MPTTRLLAVLACAFALACEEPARPCSGDRAQQFSEAAFAAIEPGMPKTEVLERLGPGLRERRRTRDDGDASVGTLIDYTTPSTCRVYDARVVALGTDDRVAWTWGGRIEAKPELLELEARPQ